MKKHIVLMIFFVLFFPTTINASEKLNPNNSHVEAIEVKGNKPLARLRDEYKVASHGVFNTFNTLIDDPDMHYICEKKRLPNSRITSTSCLDAFDIRIRNELFRRELYKSGSLMEKLYRAQASSEMGIAEIKQLKKQKHTLIINLAEQNETFKAALTALRQAKLNYEQAHISKYGSLSSFNNER